MPAPKTPLQASLLAQISSTHAELADTLSGGLQVVGQLSLLKSQLEDADDAQVDAWKAALDSAIASALSGLVDPVHVPTVQNAAKAALGW